MKGAEHRPVSAERDREIGSCVLVGRQLDAARLGNPLES
jgi:hypothetical protein